MQADEERYKGSVALDVYAKYFKAGNGYIMVTLFLFLICLDRVRLIIIIDFYKEDDARTILTSRIIGLFISWTFKIGILSFTRTQFGDDSCPRARRCSCLAG